MTLMHRIIERIGHKLKAVGTYCFTVLIVK